MSGGQRASGSSDDSAQVTVLQPALDGLHERELRYRELLDAYWNPLWKWSERAAVSGPGVENCIFREIIK